MTTMSEMFRSEKSYHGKRAKLAGRWFRFTGVVVTDFGNRYCYWME